MPALARGRNPNFYKRTALGKNAFASCLGAKFANFASFAFFAVVFYRKTRKKRKNEMIAPRCSMDSSPRLVLPAALGFSAMLA
jgi:hypothetical protein